MLIVDKLLPQGRGLAPALRARAPFVELDWDQRRRSRFEAADSTGRRLAVFLPRGTVLRGGDVLVAEDGSLAAVRAAPQALLRVTVDAAHGSAFELLRAAYHLGNRHVELELQPGQLLLEPDPVLAAMLRRMHLVVEDCQTAFEPEGGAYAAQVHGQVNGRVSGHAHDPVHGHAHGHPHADHDHDHDDDHDHDPAPAHPRPH